MENTHGVWGTRTRILQSDSFLVTVLQLEPLKKCSWHSHQTAYNLFYVVSGKLGVKTDKGYISWLNAGQSFTVEPTVKHEFRTDKESATVIEIAYVKFNEFDIDRKELGGSLKGSNNEQTR